MPADTADPGGDDRDPLFDEVIARLPLATGPEQTERLVLLGLRMVYRRDEDREQLDRMTRALQGVIAQAHDLRRVGQECARLLETAQSSRSSRQVVLHPVERTGANKEARPPLNWHRPLAAALGILLASLLLLPFTAIAIDPSLAPESWRSPTARHLTAARLAEEIAALPAGEASSLEEQGIVSHLARLIDDRPLVIIDNLPRRLCPKTAWLLARQGDVTIFDRAAPDARPSTLASLCHGENGDARLMWSPRT